MLRQGLILLIAIASLLATVVAHGEGFRGPVLIFAKPGSILFPTDDDGSPRFGSQSPDSIRFRPGCSLPKILGSLGWNGMEKKYISLHEGDSLVASEPWVYDEICSRGYVVHFGRRQEEANLSFAVIKAALMADACVDSVADPLPGVSPGDLERDFDDPSPLRCPRVLLPDGATKGSVIASLLISPQGTVAEATIDQSDLPDSSNQAVLRALKRWLFRPPRTRCMRASVSVTLPLTFGENP